MMPMPDIHVVERAGLLISLDLLVVGLFIAFLNSDLCTVLWRNTNIVIKVMFGVGLAITYLYILFPHMEAFVGWVSDSYWAPATGQHVNEQLVRPLPTR